jgi:hypothetical protein
MSYSPREIQKKEEAKEKKDKKEIFKIEKNPSNKRELSVSDKAEEKHDLSFSTTTPIVAIPLPLVTMQNKSFELSIWVYKTLQQITTKVEAKLQANKFLTLQVAMEDFLRMSNLEEYPLEIPTHYAQHLIRSRDIQLT